MRQQHDALKKRNAQVLAISVDPIEENKRFRDKLDASFPFLSDPSQDVARQYTGTPGGGMDRPSVFLVNRQGRIAWRYLGSVANRPAASEVIKQLDQIEQSKKSGDTKSKRQEPCPTLEEPEDGE